MSLTSKFSSYSKIGFIIFSQVVRYHSLVIDPKMLPKELVPIAWTSCTDPLPFFENQNADIFLDGPLSKVPNGKSSHISQSEAASSSKILMGIRHATRPHFGVQVYRKAAYISLSSFLVALLTCLIDSFILKALRLVMEDKSLKIFGISQKITGLDSEQLLPEGEALMVLVREEHISFECPD